MKSTINRKLSSLFAMLILSSTLLLAQESPSVKVNGNDVGTWFAHNWIWVAAVVLVLLLIVLFSSNSRSKRTTTVVTDRFGDVRRSSTTETEVE